HHCWNIMVLWVDGGGVRHHQKDTGKGNRRESRGPITFQVVANTAGWVGFGFSPSGSMTGSDVVIGGVNPDGTVYFACLNLIESTEYCV
uniref:DOMON domain-containing protein n=1 Tax=Erpetoichthys calabaricus TaxID=27687 RepID=A0A8C4S874_ERPCA